MPAASTASTPDAIRGTPRPSNPTTSLCNTFLGQILTCQARLYRPFPGCWNSHVSRKFSSFSCFHQIVRNNKKTKPRWNLSSPRGGAVVGIPMFPSHSTAPARLLTRLPRPLSSRPSSATGATHAQLLSPHPQLRAPTPRAPHRTTPHRHLPPRASEAAPRTTAPPRPRSPPGEATLAQAHKETKAHGIHRCVYSWPALAFTQRCLRRAARDAPPSSCPPVSSLGTEAPPAKTDTVSGHQGRIADRSRARPSTSLARPLLCPALRQARDTSGAAAWRRAYGYRWAGRKRTRASSAEAEVWAVRHYRRLQALLFCFKEPHSYSLMQPAAGTAASNTYLDITGISKEHGEAIDSHAPASCRGKAILQCSAEVFIDKHGFIITCSFCLNEKISSRGCLHRVRIVPMLLTPTRKEECVCSSHVTDRTKSLYSHTSQWQMKEPQHL